MKPLLALLLLCGVAGGQEQRKDKTMFAGFRNSNIRLVGGFRLRVLAVLGWMLGITFHVRGVPFGAANGKTGDRATETDSAVAWECPDAR